MNPAHDPFQHPEANHVVRLAQAPQLPIAYRLERAARQSVGFSVRAQGLEVRAPRALTLAQIDALLQTRAAWLLRHLQAARQRLQQQAHGRLHWQHGTQLPFLGQPLQLHYTPSTGTRLRCQLHNARAPGAPALLCVQGVIAADAAASLRRTVQLWFLRQARLHFCARLDHFAPQLGVRWQRLGLSSAQTRWGSARVDGSIRLNWRLLHLGPALVDYVVVHELSHLRHMNHSAQFWQTVASVVPDYLDLRAQLRAAITPVW